MHILLTDQLTCPRCGPEAGLVVLADEMSDRRIVQGRYGCPVCKSDFEIEDGVADLRAAEGLAPVDGGAAGTGLPERALRTAALLGVGSGHGIVMVPGASPAMVDEIAELLPNAQVVGASTSRPERAAGAGWILISDRVPFRSGSLRGVAFLDFTAEGLIDDAARVLWKESRLVLDPAGPTTAEALERSGLTVMLDQEDVLVASASAPR